VKLLGTIDSIEFSDAEKERLTQSLALVDSREHVVVSSKALQIRDNEFWRRAQKNFHITGFRELADGKSKANCASALHSSVVRRVPAADVDAVRSLRHTPTIVQSVSLVTFLCTRETTH
jgi:hypothetical protein